MKQTKLMQRIFMLLFSCLSAAVAFGQPPIDGDPGGGGVGAIPVDGGLAFLLAAGVGYGAKKAYEARKKSDKS
jgi:hypothetical protein